MKRDHMPYNFIVHNKNKEENATRDSNHVEYSGYIPKKIRDSIIKKSQKRTDEILERLRKL